ncbi:type I-U CRISPR-associated helicase/endonuclease Cas3 [Thioalkalivibrio sp. ALE23]|uniref:type I-G CRISPR-associated helicase/endonuclease Cas3g n=1 Tax=Thioalkalivibrio sp. ALE23 TaxID=1265495 RepID=UPI000361B6FF|nr:type I-U CRISPR-associated helicase/endonuclease Cas3 [Thioalkalivibrio sp. ALE23]
MPVTIDDFEAITGRSPYPWQRRCFARLLDGEIPDELALPTGTGKTSVVPLYLLALAAGAPLPRRLVYVVDRRAIVDQTTAQLRTWIDALAEMNEAREALEEKAAFRHPDAGPVAIGTLRGGLMDSGEWRLDPARPAVLVGTVDMIGSRLLFSGYGDGRSRRALHAGLLGVDTTVVLDESHLSPAFAQTLRQVEQLQERPTRHGFRAMTMSATPREVGEATLESADEADPVLGRRLRAVKRLHLRKVEGKAQWRETMVSHALARETGKTLLFTRSAQEAQRLHHDLLKALGTDSGDRVGLFTGTLRGAEREALTDSPLWKCFSEPDTEPPGGDPVYLVATAAAEVGVDLDADDMIMDLAPLDTVIQRLGRLNRAGSHSDSGVTIVYTPEDTDYKANNSGWKHRYAAACERTLELLQSLPNLAPMDLLGVPMESIQEASSPAPLFTPLEHDRIELLAGTSAGIGLPPVAPLLRGISDEPETADVHVLWRADLGLLLEQGPGACQDALTLLPPRPRETLRIPAIAAGKELAKMAETTGGFEGVLRRPDGSVGRFQITSDSQGLASTLAYGTLVLPAEVGGLSEAGFLDARKAGKAVADLADDGDALRFEKTAGEHPEDLPEWVDGAVQWWVPLHDEDDEDAEPRWWVYARRRAGELALQAETDLTRLARRAEPLETHNARVGDAAARIGHALGLDDWVVAALRKGGDGHDDGKAARIWQRAAGNPGQEPPVAKSVRGRFRPGLLGGYRHEFGSLARVDRALPVSHTDEDLQRELVLHLIAAHHGHARPGFPDRRQWDPELPDAQSEHLARDAERRYARLQARFGPWGLAWLEAILKCADAWVSSGYADLEEE